MARTGAPEFPQMSLDGHLSVTVTRYGPAAAERSPGRRHSRREYHGGPLKKKLLASGTITLAVAGWVAMPTVGSATSTEAAIPHYQHIVEIMMENTSYSTIIGNSEAPNLNALASQYGLATDYFGVTHPSEPNYMANVGGSFFGVQD